MRLRKSIWNTVVRAVLAIYLSYIRSGELNANIRHCFGATAFPLQFFSGTQKNSLRMALLPRRGAIILELQFDFSFNISSGGGSTTQTDYVLSVNFGAVGHLGRFSKWEDRMPKERALLCTDHIYISRHYSLPRFLIPNVSNERSELWHQACSSSGRGLEK